MGNTRQLRDVLGYEPILPQSGEFDHTQVVVQYNDEADTLYVYFFGLCQPAISVDLNEYLYARVNDQTHHIVGIQIEGYLSVAVRKDSRWLEWAELAGISADVIDAVRHEITLESKRQSALQTTFDELTLAIA